MSTPAPPRHTPYRGASQDFALGLRAVRPGGWIQMGPEHAAVMRQKRARLAAARECYYRSLPVSLPAQRELAARIGAHLLADHAAHFSGDGGMFMSRADGTRVELHGAPEPLWALSQLIEEDFMLLQVVDGALTITASSNAYSSSGRLVAAVGQGMAWAHAPVPGLTERLGPRIERVVSTVHESTPSERFGWQVTPLATLFFPHDDPHAANAAAAREVLASLAASPSRAGELLHIRVERQTLTRLPDTQAVAFSLHTYSDPLGSLAAEPAAARDMLSLLKGYSEARWHYSEMDILRAPLLAYLESIAG